MDNKSFNDQILTCKKWKERDWGGVVFFVEKEEEELKLQTLNKVEEEGAYKVNKLDLKWSGEEDKMQLSSNLTPRLVIWKSTQEAFMQRLDLVYCHIKPKA